jgi:hypothetical protein
MSNNAIARVTGPELIVVPDLPLDTWQPLTKFEETYQRLDHIACVSGGNKSESGIPQASRDGTIYLHDPEGRAPGLAAILKANNGRFLTIAMPSNNRADFIHQTYKRQSKTRLEAFGDRAGYTEIKPSGDRTFFAAGTPEFEKFKTDPLTKVTTNISFFLAEYDENGQPMVIFPDGFGTYRIRTSSQNTVGNLTQCLANISAFTRGHFAGFPLKMTLGNRNLTGPSGDKRNAPVFAFVMQPPNAIRLSSATFAGIARASLDVANMGMLALPEAEGIDQAIADFEMLEKEYDAAEYRRQWFAIVKGTSLDSKEGRAAFISDLTSEMEDSLAGYLLSGNHEKARALIDAAEEFISRQGVNLETGEVLEAQVVLDTPAIPQETEPAATKEQCDRIDELRIAADWDQAITQAWMKKAFAGKATRKALTQPEAERFIAHLEALLETEGEA